MSEWNLRRQLDEAKAQRRLAAGLSSDTGVGTTLPAWQGSQPDDHMSSTLTATRFAEASTPVPDTETDAVSTRTPTKDHCPSCGGKVRLDHFDLDHAVAQMSCVDCGFSYQAKSPKL